MRNGVLWNRCFAEFGSDFRFRVSIANSARNNAKQRALEPARGIRFGLSLPCFYRELCPQQCETVCFQDQPRVSIASADRNNAKRCFRDQNLFGSVCARTRSMRGSACTSVLLLCLTIFGRGAPQESYSGETCIAEQYGRKRST